MSPAREQLIRLATVDLQQTVAEEIEGLEDLMEDRQIQSDVLFCFSLVRQAAISSSLRKARMAFNGSKRLLSRRPMGRSSGWFRASSAAPN